MGDFAEDSIEREWNQFISEDNDIFDETDYFGKSKYSKRTSQDLTNYPPIDEETLQRIITNPDGFLIRKPNGRVNILATCIWQGPKSFLCRIEDFGHRADVGKKIFVPKSIVRYKKDEKLVIYLPNWAKPIYKED